jgi:DNA-binding HxlR family transcriptional regulator
MPSSAPCKIDAVLDFISDPWTLAVIHQLSIGPRRTGELYNSFAGLSTKTLGARLKKLERGAIVARKSFGESPPRVEYSLTEKGRALLRVLDAVREVAREWDSEGNSEDVDSALCRACEVTNAGTSESDLRMQGSEESPAPQKPRKRTDVTLL